MGQRKAVTKATATRYRRSDRVAKKIILDELRLRGRSGTKPGSLLKSQIPIRT